MDNTTAQPNATAPITTPDTSAPVVPTQPSPASAETPPPTQQSQPTAQTPNPGTQPPASSGVNMAPPPEKKPLSKFVIVLVVVVFLILLGVGGYLMMSKPTTPTPVAIQPTATPTVIMTSEETEVNSLDTGASDSSDLDAIQADVDSLTTPTTP